MMAGGYEGDMVRNSPYGAGASEAARKAADAAIADLKAKKPIYVGPLKDNKGKVVIDKTYDNLDPYLDQMDYLLEGRRRLDDLKSGVAGTGGAGRTAGLSPGMNAHG